MTILESPPAPSRATRGNQVRWPLPAPVRKILLLTHIVSAGAWFGMDLVVCLPVVVGWRMADTSMRVGVWQPFATWFMLPMLYAALAAGLICLLSGLLLGFTTKWGLLRYWWVAVKLALNVVMSAVLLVFLLNPIGEIGTGQAPIWEVTIVFYLAAIALALVTLASILSVFKPWGRICAVRGTRR